MTTDTPPIALLILIGGRQTPNILSAQFLRPQLVAPVASYEALQPDGAWGKVYPILKQLSPDILPPQAVDAFDLADVRSACTTVMQQHPAAHWVCNITCATTIMSIGAYEAGKACGASVWYFDTNGRRVVVLAGQAPQGDPYRLSVSEYLQIYGRTARSMPQPPQSWLDLTWHLARDPDEVIELRDQLREAKANQKYTGPRWLTNLRLSPVIQSWLPFIQTAGFIDQIHEQYGEYSLHQCHQDLWKFFDGLWLEILAWDAAQQAGCFDDCRFGVEIPIPHQGANNQIDLALTFAASMMIAECKTDKDPFLTQYLDRLSSIADMIGGSFVGKLFIAARSQQKANRDRFESFKSQAKARHIVVITGDQLLQITHILKEEVTKPTYSRM